MSKRIRIKPRTYSFSYIDVSPTKRRSITKSFLKRTSSAKPISRPPGECSATSTSSLNIKSNTCSAPTSAELDKTMRSSESPECEDFCSMDVSNSLGYDSDEKDPSQSCYSKRQQRATDNWSEVRDQLLHAAVESSAPFGSISCAVCEDPADCVCFDCGPQAHYCLVHVESTHAQINIFHRPQVFKDGMLQPYAFDLPRVIKNLQHTCDSSYVKDVICLDHKGFQHCVKVTFCKCEPEAISLIRHHMWPATPKHPTLAFHKELLEWVDSLLLEGCIGVDAFCRALDHKRGKEISSQYRKVYPVLIDAFEEFRFMQHQLKSLCFLSPQLDNSTKCPACPKIEGTQIMSMDGVFGLCRKKSAGVSVRSPLFSGVFFEDQQEVDNYVSAYDSASRILDKGCHEFLAGDALRSKSRFAALDETGVFGSICRHEYPQRFINMKHGERLAYPVFLLNKLSTNKNIMLLYDVACLLETHLRNRGQTELLSRLTLGVPIFHVYGHGAFCQVTYSPRVVPGCGLTDGEAMERLWSYLRRFSKSTKEMRPSHRLDVLTSALLHYASRVRLNIGKALSQRLCQARVTQQQASEELAKLILDSGGKLTESSVAQLEKEQQTLLAVDNTSPSYGQRHKTLKDIIRVARERKFLVATKARYADGQSIAIRLAKKIGSITNTLKRLVNRFNSMPHDSLEGTAYTLPVRLSWEIVSSLEELSSLEVTSQVGSCTVPVQLWTKVVRAGNMKKRSLEEEQMVMTEIVRVQDNLREEHSLLQGHIQELRIHVELSHYQTGILCLLNKRLLLCETALLTFAEAVSKYHATQLPNLRILGPNGLMSNTVTANVENPDVSVVDVLCIDTSDSDSNSDDECDD